MTINERIFFLLDERNLKQADLAQSLNIRTSVIGNWKTRGTNPPAELLIPICEFFDISIYELLGVKNKTLSELEILYSRASTQDKETINFILSRYKHDQEQPSSTSMIG